MYARKDLAPYALLVKISKCYFYTLLYYQGVLCTFTDFNNVAFSKLFFGFTFLLYLCKRKTKEL